MYLRKATYFDFRNLSLTVELGPGFNVFTGANGQGKTNLLEGIYVTCFGRGFRPGKLSHLIRHGATACRVGLEVVERDSVTELGLLMQGSDKNHSVAGKERCSLNEVAQSLRLIFFGPDDLALVKGAPALRREFLDRAIWVHYPPYFDLMKRYLQHMKERNRIHKEIRDGVAHPKELLPAVEEEMIRQGAQVISYRLKYLRELVPEAVKLVREHTADKLELTSRYQCSLLPESTGGAAPPLEAKELIPLYAAALERTRDGDKAAGTTSVGPHVDDLELELQKKPARFFGSQGEQRAVAVCLKLAQLALWTQRFNVKPVLLLDDVSSELDQARTTLLMKTIASWGIQTLLTTTSPPVVLLGDPAVRLFKVDAGHVQPMAHPSTSPSPRPGA